MGITIRALGLLCLLLAPLPSGAVPFDVPGQGLNVNGTATFAGGVWQYRYTIRETMNLDADPIRFIVSEHGTHAGLHHEANFMNDGGTFSYDFAVPPQFMGISAHNYFWNDLDVLARGVFVVGFDDEHGPGLASWGIQRFGAGHVELTNLLPVPRVSEPSGLSLLAIGMLMLGGLALKRAIAKR